MFGKMFGVRNLYNRIYFIKPSRNFCRNIKQKLWRDFFSINFLSIRPDMFVRIPSVICPGIFQRCILQAFNQDLFMNFCRNLSLNFPEEYFENSSGIFFRSSLKKFLKDFFKILLWIYVELLPRGLEVSLHFPILL